MAKRVWIGLGLLLCVCTTATVYKHNFISTDWVWHVDTIPDFQFQVKDTTRPYDICLRVKNNPDYPYQNLWLTYYLENDTAGVLATALKEYALFDLKTGKPLGEGIGQIKKHQLVLMQAYWFPYAGPYTLKVAHFMRTNALPGLHAVGVTVMQSTQAPK